MHVFPSSVEIIKLSIVMALELRSCEFNAKTLADELGSIAKWHDQKQNACIAIWINMLIIFWEHGYSSVSNLNMYPPCAACCRVWKQRNDREGWHGWWIWIRSWYAGDFPIYSLCSFTKKITSVLTQNWNPNWVRSLI